LNALPAGRIFVPFANKGGSMKRLISPVGVVVVALLLPVGAGANTQWICTVDGNRTVFVNAADAAKHGLTQADSKAGVVFETKFGEENCHIESTP
jgi:hypothetical protein